MAQQRLLSIDIFFADDDRRIAHALWPQSSLTLEILSNLLSREQSHFQDHQLSFEWKDEEDYHVLIDDDEDLRSAVQKQTKDGSSSLRFFVTATPNHRPVKREREKEHVDSSSSSSAQDNGEKRQRTDETSTQPLNELIDWNQEVVHSFEKLEQALTRVSTLRERDFTERILSSVKIKKDLKAHGLTHDDFALVLHEKKRFREMRRTRERDVSARCHPSPPPPPSSSSSSSSLPSRENNMRSVPVADAPTVARLQAALEDLQEQMNAQAAANQAMFDRLFEMQESMERRFQRQLADVLQSIQQMEKKKTESSFVREKQDTIELVREWQRSQEQFEARMDEGRQSRAAQMMNIEIEDAESARMRREYEERVNGKLLVVRRCFAEAKARRVSPLYYACEAGDVEGALALLDSEEYMESIALENESIAIQDYMKVPMKERLNRPEKSRNEETPLHAAAKNGHTDLASFLIACNADTAVKDRSLQFTPMHFAANNGHTDTVSVLIDQGANMNEIDKDGRTPLHIAASRRQSEIVSVLIEKKANIEAKDKTGKTALDLASNNEEMRKLLSKGTKKYNSLFSLL